MIHNIGAAPLAKYPKFTYTGEYTFIEDSEENWRIKFLTSGMLTFKSLGNAKNGIDIFLVGGGGAAGKGAKSWAMANGGGGGYNTLAEATPEKGVEYKIVVGAGGSKTNTDGGRGLTGGTSSAFSLTAKGGGGGAWTDQSGNGAQAGNGGSGGGGLRGSGGSNGSDGKGSYAGKGAGFNCYEFRETESGVLYCGGGIGSYTNGSQAGVDPGAGGGGDCEVNGKVNTGGGGGGSWTYGNSGGAGGSGIVIIRNRRAS